MSEHVQDMHKWTDTKLAQKIVDGDLMAQTGMSIIELAQQVLDLAAEVERLNKMLEAAQTTLFGYRELLNRQTGLLLP